MNSLFAQPLLVLIVLLSLFSPQQLNAHIGGWGECEATMDPHLQGLRTDISALEGLFLVRSMMGGAESEVVNEALSVIMMGTMATDTRKFGSRGPDAQLVEDLRQRARYLQNRLQEGGGASKEGRTVASSIVTAAYERQRKEKLDALPKHDIELVNTELANAVSSKFKIQKTFGISLESKAILDAIVALYPEIFPNQIQGRSTIATVMNASIQYLHRRLENQESPMTSFLWRERVAMVDRIEGLKGDIHKKPTTIGFRLSVDSDSKFDSMVEKFDPRWGAIRKITELAIMNFIDALPAKSQKRLLANAKARLDSWLRAEDRKETPEKKHTGADSIKKRRNKHANWGSDLLVDVEISQPEVSPDRLGEIAIDLSDIRTGRQTTINSGDSNTLRTKIQQLVEKLRTDLGVTSQQELSQQAVINSAIILFTEAFQSDAKQMMAYWYQHARTEFDFENQSGNLIGFTLFPVHQKFVKKIAEMSPDTRKAGSKFYQFGYRRLVEAAVVFALNSNQ